MSLVVYPKPPILHSFPREGHVVIEASAGTGKTYTLEHLVIEMLLATTVPLDRFLIVTFTEKAATELRARLRRKLTSLLDATKNQSNAAEHAWPIDETARNKLAQALMSFDSASISTIHAFCHRILAENAFDNQRLFQEELVEGRSVFSQAFLTTLRQTFARNPEYSELLELWLEHDPLERLVDLLFDAHQRRGQFLPVYDPKTIRNLLHNLSRQRLVPHVLTPALRRTSMPAATQSAILERIAVLRRLLETFHKDASVPRFLASIAVQDQDRPGGFLEFITARLKDHVTRAGVLSQLLTAIEGLVDGMVTLPSAIVQSFLPVVQERLTHDKTHRGQIDFDDMLRLLAEGLQGPNGDVLCRALQHRYRFGLIDEFQDTDAVQWQIFQRIFLTRAPQHRLFVIGDPKQAIYGFRGADVHTYLTARQHLAEVGGKVLPLKENFRSSPELIEAVNHILRQDKPHPFFTGDIRYEHPVTPGRHDTGELVVDGKPLNPVHIFHVQPQKEKMGPRKARATLGPRIAREIHRLLAPESQSTWQYHGKTHPLLPHHIYILTRSTQEGLEIGNYLRRARVPYSFYKQEGLFQTREAQDIRDLLAAVAEPHLRSRRLRAWQTPFFAVELERLPDCLDLAPSHPLVGRLLTWKELADEKRYDALFVRIIGDSRITERELFLQDSERELTNYLHILEILLEHTSNTKSSLKDIIYTLTAFIERRRLPEGDNANIQRLESERDAVQIMTMHKAKGLEAAVVFLFGGFETVYGQTHVYHKDGQRYLYVGDERPDAIESEGNEEDQRLLYVAITRAKVRLYLPYFGPIDHSEGPSQRQLHPFRGSYRQLNPQLDECVTSRNPDIIRLFSVEPVPEVPPSPQIPGKESDRLARWTPPSELLVSASPSDVPQQLKRDHAGIVITSYSRIKATQGGYTPSVPDRIEPAGADEIVDEVDVGVDPEQDRMLPAGTASGRFLHEMLELVPLDTVREAPGWQFWGARRDIRALFESGLRKYNRSPLHLMHAVQLVFTALSSPIKLGKSRMSGGIIASDRIVREMEFLYPLPHPPPHRGYVKGFIDLVFEYKDRIYLLDWKSDLLPHYGTTEVRTHVEKSYQVQAELYTLALIKLLGMTEEDRYNQYFGGLVYGFVRGLQPNGKGKDGIYFDRPTWRKVQSYEATWAELDVNLFIEDIAK